MYIWKHFGDTASIFWSCDEIGEGVEALWISDS